jgi:hypothetical protein
MNFSPNLARISPSRMAISTPGVVVSRHGVLCKPGLYHVAALMPIESMKFLDIFERWEADAVIDDHGDLVKVSQ